MYTKLALAAALLITGSAAAADRPYVQSHRGGSIRDGVATFAEESMPGFRSAWRDEHSVLELDVKLSKDRVPVVIHDATLDRTTVCTGDVDTYTWDQLRTQCPSDVLGIGSITRPAVPPVRMTRLSELLRYARRSGAYLNLEIKNLPGDDDFDPSSAFATTVCDEIVRSRFPIDHLIVQSFYPPNLDVAEQEIPGVQTSLLTFAADPASAIATAARGYEWWSPSGIPTAQAVTLAHGLGLKVVPWTIDTPADVQAVRAAGADAVITNDPVMAWRALGVRALLARSAGAAVVAVLVALGPSSDRSPSPAPDRLPPKVESTTVHFLWPPQTPSSSPITPPASVTSSSPTSTSSCGNRSAVS